MDFDENLSWAWCWDGTVYKDHGGSNCWDDEGLLRGRHFDRREVCVGLFMGFRL